MLPKNMLQGLHRLGAQPDLLAHVYDQMSGADIARARTLSRAARDAIDSDQGDRAKRNNKLRRANPNKRRAADFEAALDVGLGWVRQDVQGGRAMFVDVPDYGGFYNDTRQPLLTVGAPNLNGAAQKLEDFKRQTRQGETNYDISELRVGLVDEHGVSMHIYPPALGFFKKPWPSNANGESHLAYDNAGRTRSGRISSFLDNNELDDTSQTYLYPESRNRRGFPSRRIDRSGWA